MCIDWTQLTDFFWQDTNIYFIFQKRRENNILKFSFHDLKVMVKRKMILSVLFSEQQFDKWFEEKTVLE